MFDIVNIVVRGGDGGDGAVSFRREKFVALGGPDGGDGGGGGNVIIVADSSVSALLRFRSNRVYRAGDGGNGEGKRKHGRGGKDLVLAVPAGTLISYRAQIGEPALADLAHPGERVVVARGGRGGFGNTHYVSPTNQAPRLAQKGEPGEENSIVLEMRLIADVGIIGRPNVGKSSLLAAASAASPKIASYPFTTREPALGVVNVDQRSFVVAEIPGLIEDAHLGRGLGHDFLRHVLRTRMLIHLIDGTSSCPVEDMNQVSGELTLFDSALSRKPQLVAVNKVDLPEVRSRVSDIRSAFREAGTEVLFISAATGEGVPGLMDRTLKALESIDRQRDVTVEKAPPKIFHPQPRRARFSVRREGDIFIIEAPELERIAARTDVTSPERRRELERELRRRGVSQALEKSGAKPGDKVRLGNFEWEW